MQRFLVRAAAFMVAAALALSGCPVTENDEDPPQRIRNRMKFKIR
jgi:hypothetical protein